MQRTSADIGDLTFKALKAFQEMVPGRRVLEQKKCVLVRHHVPGKVTKDHVEAHAKRSLEHGIISYVDVEDLLRKVAAIIPATTQRKNILDADMQPVRSHTVVLYCHAGSMGITTLTKEMPNFVKVLNAFFKQDLQGGTFVWSSITVNWNVQSAPHKDANNMGPSKITAY